jgi:serine/threonine protein kinase
MRPQVLSTGEKLTHLYWTKLTHNRDIKPENLLFYPTPLIPSKNRKMKPTDEEDKADEGEFIPGIGAGGIGVIKIADFGLSKVIWDSVTMTPCGTVGYTAPEIVKDERYSKSVDMWALGCVLYTLLCGFPPFYDESIQTLTEKVARGQYTFLSPWWDEISSSAKDLISNLLTVDPDKRYDIHQFLNHPWIKVADGAPLTAAKSNPQLAHLDETPGSMAKRMDFRSPGAVNLREVFDVSYAVHRQEEEGKRRGKNKGFNATNLNSLDEDEEDEEESEEFHNESVPYDPNSSHLPAKLPRSSQSAQQGQGGTTEQLERQLRNATLSSAAGGRTQAPGQDQARRGRAETREEKGGKEQGGYGQHSAAVAAAARRSVKNRAPFELSMDNATLLGRRKKPVGQSGLREQMV